MATTAGILTLSASDNCGSLLQAYALQQTLMQRYCAQVQIIDFDSVESRNMYSVFPPHPLRYPKNVIRGLLFYAPLKKQKQDYRKFRQDHLRMTSKKYLSVKDLTAVDGQYEYIIIGSDQVWNIPMLDFNDGFLLDWVRKSKKVAYAPSLGCNDFSMHPLPDRLKENLLSYTALSTRELGGQRAIEAITGVTAPILADPTLLLPREQWEALAGPPMTHEEYIFYYSYAYENHRMNQIVSAYAKAAGLKVYVINASRWLRRKPKALGFTLFPINGPMAFLNLMKYAKKVFVESFHGIIFANIFQRDFYFLNNLPEGKMDPRPDSILTLHNQKNRAVRSLEDILPEPVDYSHETIAFRELREKSFAYLDGIFAEEVLPL